MLISYMRGDGPELHQDGNFLEHPFLQRGLLWGIGRLAEQNPELLQPKVTPEDVLFYLNSEDVELRGLAVRTAGFLHMTDLKDAIKGMQRDEQDFLLYENGQLVRVRLNQLIDDFTSKVS
jgi:hypothetical protein